MELALPRPNEDLQVQEDARDLAGLGYARELFRGFGGFSNFAIRILPLPARACSWDIRL
jgi:hypothetical protein